MSATYKIVRHFFKLGREDVDGLSGLTLDEAQAHCADPETSSSTCTLPAGVRRTAQHGPWFDGYTEE